MKRPTDSIDSARSDLESFQLGDWTVHPQVNRVSSGSETVQIEPKMMELLVFLAATPNRVASRRELLENVWGDVVVGDEVLSRAIFELRRVLHDSSKSPRYIETIHKRGYRLVADVRTLSESEESVTQPGSSSGRMRLVRALAIPAVLLLAVVAIVFVQVADLGPSKQPTTLGSPIANFGVKPVTTYPGYEETPAISPDGNRVAFAWNGPARDNVDLYVKQIIGGAPVRLTTHSGVDRCPSWSPDGLEVAYVHRSGAGGQICIIGAMGGERRTIPTQGSIEGGIDWSPSAPVIVCSERLRSGEPSRIVTYDVRAGDRLELTPAAALAGDGVSPAFSPDGSLVAFVYKVWSGFDRICTVGSDGGDLRTITDSLTYVADFDWYPGGEAVLCTAWFRGVHAMWRVDVADGTIERLPDVGRYAVDLALERSGHRLVYQDVRCDASVWRVSVAGASDTPAHEQPLAESTKMDFHPDLSHGGRVAFVSTRSGSYEVWVCGSDGSNPFKLTSFDDCVLMLPRWSPDERTIAVTVLREGRRSLYAVDVASRHPSRLIHGEPLVAGVNWSRDGEWIYFTSDRGGRIDVWRMRWQDPDSDAAVQVTRAGSAWGVESLDGIYFYHNRIDEPGLFRVHLGGVADSVTSVRVVDDLPAAGLGSNWDVCEDAVVVVDDAGGDLNLVRHEIVGGARRILMSLPDDARQVSVISTSADGEVVLYDRARFTEADLILVEKYR